MALVFQGFAFRLLLEQRGSLKFLGLAWPGEKSWVGLFLYVFSKALNIAIGQCLIAGAVGVWFFTSNADKGSRRATWLQPTMAVAPTLLHQVPKSRPMIN